MKRKRQMTVNVKHTQFANLINKGLYEPKKTNEIVHSILFSLSVSGPTSKVFPHSILTCTIFDSVAGEIDS